MMLLTATVKCIAAARYASKLEGYLTCTDGITTDLAVALSTYEMMGI